MPLTGSATVWRDAIISALGISFTGLSAAEETAIKASWLAICQTHITHITANALVSTTGVTGAGTPPLTITAQPGTIS